MGEKVSSSQARAAWSLSPVIKFIITAALAIFAAIEAMTRDKPAAE